MSLVRRLRARLTYANVMSSIALFVALSGGAYALKVPKHSIGSRELRRGAVTSPKVRDHSLKRNDFRRGVLPKAVSSPLLGGVRAADSDPPGTPGVAIKSVDLSLTSQGQAFVLATLRDVYLTCGEAACEAQWGIYVDSRPVPATGVRLQADIHGSDGYTFYTLYGLTPPLAPGKHTVTLGLTSAGGPASVGQLGAQLGALTLGS